jgi:flagellar hook-length control protein FliK
MNATPMNLNAGQAVQAQSAAGKPQDSAAPDTPFSQILSSEIAQNRSRSEAQQDTGTQAGKDAAQQADRPAEDTALAAETAGKTPPEEVPFDPLAPLVAGAATTPEAVIALALNPDGPKPAPAPTDAVDAAQAADLAAFQDARKGLAAQPASSQPSQGAREALPPPATQAGQAAQSDSDRPGKTTLQQATLQAAATAATTATAATASAFSGQLAAARQSDAMKTGEFVSDLMSNPAMRPATHGPLEALNTLSEAAAPRLAPAVGTPAWGQALGDKIVWMATAAQQTATLTLNPPNMGPLQIVVNVSNEQATASFFSAQPEVRQALEAAFPRLKEMMNEAGIQLGQATVSADTPRQDAPAHRQGQAIASPFHGTDDPAATALLTGQVPVQQSGRGLVDTFA